MHEWLFRNLRDENKQPSDIQVSIVPCWNTFCFFEVTPTSFHQVSEILSSKERVSISGWFHSPVKPSRPPPFKETAFHVSRPLSSSEETEEVLKKLINPLYLSKDSMEAINKTFLENSALELKDFLRDDVYQAILKQLDAYLKERQKRVGPANRRNYQRIPLVAQEMDTFKEKESLHSLLRLLTSVPFANFLETLTGIKPSHYYGEARNFEHGDYTLIHDDALEPVGLDFVLFFLDQTWKEDWGGQLVYMDRDSVLQTTLPSANSLLLTYRDEGVMRFVKYVNHYAENASRKDISFVYMEDS